MLNTHLLGREFFESAAGHHHGKPEARQMLKQNRAAVYAGGLVITLLTLTPIVNLFMPLVAVVWMVHLYHWIRTGEARGHPDRHRDM